MLLNTLDTFIGFIGVMLVLSLVVTALVQFVQNSLRIRAKNLRVGLQALLDKLPDDKTTKKSSEGANPEKPSSLEKGRAQELREKVLKSAPFVPDEHSWINTLFSPTTTWVTEEELLEHLNTAGVTLSAAEMERLPLLFDRMEDYLRKRFILSVRIITIVCSVLVAAYFQVSTPALLIRLSHDDKYRAQAVGAAEQVYKDAPALIAASTNYQNVSAMALEQLTARHPEHAALLERASGLGPSHQDMVAELRAALAPLPAATQLKIAAEYEQLLTDLQEKAVKDARGQLGELTGRLAKFDITPWPEGWKFFRKPQNYVGLLITAIFLTFGAPFWYERLRQLIQLRDALKPKPPSPDGEDSATDDDSTRRKKKSREG